MTSPNDLLFEKLRMLAVAHTETKLGPLLALRDAIDAYERALRHESEREIVERFDELAVDLGDGFDSTLARANVGTALHAALAWFSPDEPVGLAASDEPEPSRVAENEADPGVGGGDGAQAGDENPPVCSQALSPAAITAFFDQLRSTPAAPPEDRRQARATERQTLRDLLDRVGEIPDLTGDVAVIEELERIEEVSDDTIRARWDALGDQVLQSWLTMLVARLRALRDRIDVGSSLHQRHKLVINRLPAYRTARAMNGFINGMAKTHAPKFGTWVEDARRALADLRGSTDDRIDDPASERPMGKRRSAPLRPAKHVQWSYRSVVATKHILLFGGTSREEARRNIQESLGIGELSWLESDRPRQLSALLDGLARYDLVLVNRFVGHKESTALVAAAKAQGKPFRVVDSYGVDTIRRVLTELLATADEAPAS
jgi:hypothetical protein